MLKKLKAMIGKFIAWRDGEFQIIECCCGERWRLYRTLPGLIGINQCYALGDEVDRHTRHVMKNKQQLIKEFIKP